jgi:hypothetical protein
MRVSMARSDERGIALVMALLMVLLVSILTASMIAVARSEAMSSVSYRAMSQVRYGAESGVHAAVNHLLNTYVPPGINPADPLASYDMTVSPVTFGVGGDPVVLSSDPGVDSNYPVNDVRDAFIAGSRGTLNANGRQITYAARARLISMRQLTNAFTGTPATLQTWEIEGVGSVDGAGAATVEVVATLERQPVPAFSYAAFATFNGCDALSFAGGATTKSYDSSAPLVGGKPDTSPASGGDTYGNVGTNGNLETSGQPTQINGTLSTPRSGIGNCTTNNVTAATLANPKDVTGGLVTLPQPIEFPTPDPISPAPPTNDVGFSAGGCPSGAPYCAKSDGEFTLAPPAGTVVQMGNVKFSGNAVLNLHGGTYEVNSLSLGGNGTINVVPGTGPVIIKIAGKDSSGNDLAMALNLEGNGVSNPTYDPTMLQFIYGGKGTVKLTGGSDAAMLVYAPNASGSISGGADFYGSIVTNKITATGGSTINYDRRLQRSMLVPGNPAMSSFSWRTF